MYQQHNLLFFTYIFINNFFTFINSSTTILLTIYIFYRSDLTPTPGPGGGAVNDVSPPAGSAANLVEV